MQSGCLYTKEMFENAEKEIKKPLERKRAAVAHDTFKIVSNTEDHAQLVKHAQENLARWKAEKKGNLNSDPVITVHRGDWGDVTAALTKEFGETFAVLNMANPYLPGGSWLRSPAQEENIFRRTDACLSITKNQAMLLPTGEVKADFPLIYNEAHIDLISGQHGLVAFDMTPRVCFRSKEESKDLTMSVESYKRLDDKKIFPFYELRSAAVDCGQQGTVAFKEEDMRHRINAQLKTLKENNIRHVVLGAFGCGVFKNPADKVAKLYLEALQSERFRGAFDQVHFAIYATSIKDKNFEAFNKELNKKPLNPTEQILAEPLPSSQPILVMDSFQSARDAILEVKANEITAEMVKNLYEQTPLNAVISAEEDTFNKKLVNRIIALKLEKDKKAKNTKLCELLKQCTEVEELNQLFVLLRVIEDLNHHKNEKWDFCRFFTWNSNTKTWQNTMREIRDHAFSILHEKQEKTPKIKSSFMYVGTVQENGQRKIQLENEDKKWMAQQELLKSAESAAIFKDHINNSFFWAWGRTRTVREIQVMQSELPPLPATTMGAKGSG